MFRTPGKGFLLHKKEHTFGRSPTTTFESVGERRCEEETMIWRNCQKKKNSQKPQQRNV
jgi:hypothetical protein